MSTKYRWTINGRRSVWLVIAALAVTACGGGSGGSSGGPPTTLAVTLSTPTASPTNSNAIPVSVSFSAAVSDFSAGKLMLDNATVTNFTGSGASYSFELVPSATGTVAVSVPNGAVRDAAGAANSASQELSLVFNDTPPTVTVATTVPNPTNESPIPVTVTFSEAVSGFSAAGLSVTNATVSGLSGSGASYNFQLTPAGTGTVSVAVDAAAANDAAGNANLASTALSLEFNDTPPTVTLATTAPNPTTLTPIPVTVSFGEAVTGFTAAGLSAINATVSGFTGSGASYSFQLTPTTAGSVSVMVDAAAARDAAGNANLASTTLSRSYQPVVTVAPSLSSGANITIAPNSVQTVNPGANVTLMLTANGGEILSKSVGGTCPAGTWSSYGYATGSYVTGAIAASCTVVFTVTGGTVRYSKAPGNIYGGSGTLTDPYLSIYQNIDVVNAGDVIFLLPGTYNECLYMAKSGTANMPITMTGAGTAPAKGAATTGGSSINCTQTKTGAVYMVPAYVTITNLTIGPSPNAGSGLFINSNATGICHNVVVDHVTIHDTSGAGYQSVLCGALTLTNSIFYGNGLTYANACTSGISLAGNIDDGTMAYDNVVDGNVAYGNGNPTHCNPAITGFNSDGEGIIIDYGPDATPCASYTYFSSLPQGYYCAATARTLISDNIFYNNQSAGIEVFNGNNADIINNTLYHNETASDHTSAEFGEIKVGGLSIGPIAKSVNIENNILVPYRSSNPGIACQYLSDVLVANNLNGNSASTLFSAQSACSSYTLQGNVTASASATLFANPSTPNFQLASGSPAIGIAQNLESLIGSNSLYAVLGLDYTQESRSTTGNWDAGACQYVATSAGSCP